MGHLIGIMLSPSGGPAVHTGAQREHPHVLDGLGGLEGSANIPEPNRYILL
jgi:hypothetical protein